MKTWVLYTFIRLLLLSLPLQLWAQPGKSVLSAQAAPVAEARQDLENPLFLSDEVLHFKLAMDVKEVLKDRGDERKSHRAVITYTDSGGAKVEEKLKVRVRGNRRRDPSVCNFPPIQLNFSRKTVEETIFGKVNKLKMVTHCLNDEYVLREYLVYKLYNVVTDTSYRVRLCRVQYEDLKGKRKTVTQYAFLIEDDDIMAGRHNATVLPEALVVRMDRAATMPMAKMAFFQFMIGNTDWSVPYRHNIDLLMMNPNSPPVPVPFDFDYAGIVSTPYASPPPELGISTVRQRLFRGYSYPDKVYVQMRDFYNKRKSAIYKVYTDFSQLDRRYRRQTLKYLDQFYEVLNDPKDFHNAFVRQGQQNERASVVVKGLD
ncbi:hypothetical protein [Pontibacter anaerobius]|uniref:DUF3857 domain-containing protein n=1 Tax=Pontibacter anaerobius TaxID=2993940 RepID=A0ABT3RKD9_9BACT|nr:hypothetical protein [Pontibacter anaerobius]MCX2741772.1 hypothetical protein [Pontibacter anaerobius]